MTIAESNLDTAKAVFFAHKNACKNGCGHFELHRTHTLSSMCLAGTQLYKALLKAEDAIITIEKGKERANETRAMRREQRKQLEAQK